MSKLNLIDGRTISKWNEAKSERDKKEKEPDGQKQAGAIRSGDTVRVHQRIQEGDKERVQVFEGAVIKIHRAGANSTFTVRKISYGIGVEKVFRTFSPLIEKVEVKQPGKVRRSRLYYLRDLKGKAARIKEKREV